MACFNGTEGVWLKGNLHTHTTRSDGKFDVGETARRYRERGYDFLALTDHRIFAEGGEAEGLIVLPGMEMDVNNNSGSYWKCYHFVGLFGDYAPESKHPTEPITDEAGGQAVIDSMRGHGAEVIFAHPLWSRTTLSEFMHLENYFAMEIYNHGCYYEGQCAIATVYWDELLKMGKRIYCVATDDAHNKRSMFGGFVRVLAADRSAGAIREALLGGRFYASTGPDIDAFYIDGDEVVVKCPPARDIHFNTWPNVGSSVTSAKTKEPVTEGRFKLTGRETYIRAEVVDEHGYTAWTQPIYFT